ncbi:TonB-dependent receptor [Novosphingobium sp. 1949]|uniref:TonB-dependent receptor n=1 Tax=Novosphingobium organovorum TaxID=2930092 RepID=A0ABT0BIM4_9SPHN|nr:TonB-dependent receptor [Novosphingobium organovorum]MCJ2184785.1 TonB-dependent receptor [Novosphingobium organovorum]
MNRIFVCALLAGTAWAAGAHAAFAQDAAPNAPANAAAKSAATTSDAEDAGEIIVTAMKRAGSVQKTPASIAVIGAETLQETGTSDLASAVENVPAVQVQRSNTGASFYIRGIGSRGVGGSSPVSVNIDGVYQQKGDIIAGAFADVERIEVLRGPQGTLYGRNANGGTVNIITNDPHLDENSADITLGVGNYSAIHAEAAVNLALTPTLAIRAVGAVDRHDGYLSNGLDDQNDRIGRIKVLWQPDPALRVLLSYEHFAIDKKGAGNVIISDDVANKRYAEPYNEYTVLTTGDAVYCSPNCQPYYRVDADQFNAQIDYDFGFAKLTALTGIQRYTNRHLQAFSGGLEWAYEPLDQESYEVRLASADSSPISWVVGGYWLDQDLSGETKYVLHIADATYYPLQQDRSRAVFGQATLPLTSALRLTAGLRYTKDTFRKKMDGGTVDGSVWPAQADYTESTAFTGSYDKVTYTAGIEYDLAAQAMLYGKFSTGFRSGGIDDNGGAYGPENIKAIEGGIKSRLLGSMLTLNLGGYYYFYNGYQLDYVVQGADATSDTVTTSNIAGTTRVWGAELEAQLRPSANDTLNAAIAYQGSRFAAANIATSCDSDGTCTYTDLTGRSLPRSPKWTLNGAYEHAFDLADGSRIKAHVDAMFKSAYQADVITFTYSRQAPYAIVNARLVYELPGGAASVSAYVNNLSNQTVIEQANTAGPTTRYGILNAPRTYGVTLTGHF